MTAAWEPKYDESPCLARREYHARSQGGVEREQEDGAEARAVAEPAQLEAERRAVQAVLGTRDVGDVSPPPRRAVSAARNEAGCVRSLSGASDRALRAALWL